MTGHAGKAKSYSTAVLKMPDISGKDFIPLKQSSKFLLMV